MLGTIAPRLCPCRGVNPLWTCCLPWGIDDNSGIDTGVAGVTGKADYDIKNSDLSFVDIKYGDVSNVCVALC